MTSRAERRRNERENGFVRLVTVGESEDELTFDQPTSLLIEGTENTIQQIKQRLYEIIEIARPDYYVEFHSIWGVTDSKKACEMMSNYQHGDIQRLPINERTEGLMIRGETRDNSSRRSEMYRIVRENPNDDTSKILKVEKGEDEAPMDFNKPGGTKARMIQSCIIRDVNGHAYTPTDEFLDSYQVTKYLITRQYHITTKMTMGNSRWY